MMVRILSIFVFVLLAIVICMPVHAHNRQDQQSVSATYYLPTGNPMANGQPYDPTNVASAAGPQWLLGRTVRLTLPQTGRSLDVDINDVEPAFGRHGLFIDLTPAAFRQFAELSRGRIDLDLQVLR